MKDAERRVPDWDKSEKYPRWIGPYVGAGVGLAVGYRVMQVNAIGNWFPVILGGVAGLLAGCTLWIFDEIPQKKKSATTAGSILALMACLLGLVPVIGIIIGLIAYLTNRRIVGWQNVASKIGFCLSVVILVVIAMAFALKP